MISDWAKPAPHPNTPDLPGFETHYGCRVSVVGEDGEMIILGHAGKLRTLAAFNAYSRRTVGLKDISDGIRPADMAQYIEGISHRWATTEDGSNDYDWVMQTYKTCLIGAFPITIYIDPDYEMDNE